MTDHEPDSQLTCRIYCCAIGGALTIFALGVYVGTLIA